MIKSFECFQCFQQSKLRKVKEVDLACGRCRILKVACRTGIACLEGVFCVKEVYEKNDSQKGKKKNYIEIFFLNLTHITL